MQDLEVEFPENDPDNERTQISLKAEAVSYSLGDPWERGPRMSAQSPFFICLNFEADFLFQLWELTGRIPVGTFAWNKTKAKKLTSHCFS